jgi:hypothetical protein
MRKFKSFAENTSAIISVFGVAASAFEFLRYLKVELSWLALAIGIATVCLATLAGALSVYVVQGAKLLRRTPRVFLSYSQDNAEIAEKVATALRSAGAFVWFDKDQLTIGEEIAPAIKNAITEANSFVVLFSNAQGAFQNFELGVAQANNIPVIAASSDDRQISSNANRVYRFRLNENDPKSLNELVRIAINPEIASEAAVSRP